MRFRAAGFVPWGPVAPSSAHAAPHVAGTPVTRAMAPLGRKRKAARAPGEAAEDKRGKLAAGAALLIEHCTS